tara:strand:- start:386 stop:520 length:135 start_codon:yes stop_codon:yes gene_type:complete
MLADPALGSTNMFGEKLAAELGLPVFVTMPNIRQLLDELSKPRG